MTVITAAGSAIGRSKPIGPPGGDWTIESLWLAETPCGAGPIRGGALPEALRARHAAPLAIPLRVDRPTIIANFVATLDGVVALDRSGATGGREISGGFEPDRFLMGLLRATADAVLVGAGTVRASRTGAWTPARAHPPSSSAYQAWRRELGPPEVEPTTVVVTASGALDARRLNGAQGAPTIVVTTDSGARRLDRLRWPPDVEVIVLADSARVPVDGLVAWFRERRFELVVSEGGPVLFGQLLAARAVDELFLTVAPHIAGRHANAPRLGLIEGFGFPSELAARAQLRSIQRGGDHLFLRYRLPMREGKE